MNHELFGAAALALAGYLLSYPLLWRLEYRRRQRYDAAVEAERVRQLRETRKLLEVSIRQAAEQVGGQP